MRQITITHYTRRRQRLREISYRMDLEPLRCFDPGIGFWVLNHWASNFWSPIISKRSRSIKREQSNWGTEEQISIVTTTGSPGRYTSLSERSFRPGKNSLFADFSTLSAAVPVPKMENLDPNIDLCLRCHFSASYTSFLRVSGEFTRCSWVQKLTSHVTEQTLEPSSRRRSTPQWPENAVGLRKRSNASASLTWVCLRLRWKKLLKKLGRRRDVVRASPD